MKEKELIGHSDGGGLANDHPVDFTYSAALATGNSGLQTPIESAPVHIPATTHMTTRSTVGITSYEWTIPRAGYV